MLIILTAAAIMKVQVIMTAKPPPNLKVGRIAHTFYLRIINTTLNRCLEFHLLLFPYRLIFTDWKLGLSLMEIHFLGLRLIIFEAQDSKVCIIKIISHNFIMFRSSSVKKITGTMT